MSVPGTDNLAIISEDGADTSLVSTTSTKLLSLFIQTLQIRMNASSGEIEDEERCLSAVRYPVFNFDLEFVTIDEGSEADGQRFLYFVKNMSLNRMVSLTELFGFYTPKASLDGFVCDTKPWSLSDVQGFMKVFLDAMSIWPTLDPPVTATLSDIVKLNQPIQASAHSVPSNEFGHVSISSSNII